MVLDHKMSSIKYFMCAFLVLQWTEAKPLIKSVENAKPIIGVMTQAVTSSSLMKYGNSYLPENYVNYLQSAGARVVPVLINQTDDYYNMLYQSINGLLFPGGASPNLLESGLGKAGMFFYQKSIKGYDQSSDYFPLWGTCEGFQLLSMLTAQKDLLTNTDTEDKVFPLTLAKDYKDSRLFGSSAMGDDILHILTTKNITYNAHNWALTTKNYSANTDLKKFYRIISTNIDDHGIEFISTMEAFKYPIYGIQWHPEKSLFQWTDGHIPHDDDAVRVAQYMANFFVGEARKSTHKFKSEDQEAQHLIYNARPAVNIGNVIDGKRYYFWTV
ncbi:gamma-glutamyl hydrolase-like isoform X2 [Amphiura filiformis]|uniref:gamma-glutamyl hydrolase-like isoform X2 n=1 Tax=Amphiura filiformis TaxID=82378 RepID=UPI003B216C70